jgi:hypothetical protein
MTSGSLCRHLKITGRDFANLRPYQLLRFQLQHYLFQCPALINAITDYIRDRNKKPKLFTWVASADQIIRKVRRCLAISEAGH